LDILGAARYADDVTWWENRAGDGRVWTKRTVDGAFEGAASVYSADLDGDGDLDVLGAAYYADDVTWWENRGGQFALATADTALAEIGAGKTDDVLTIVATHRGRTDDTDLELATFDLLFEASAREPLTTTEANNLIENLMVYVDANANGTFERVSDTLVTTVGSLSLTAGVEIVTFSDADPEVQVQHGAPRTYFVAAELTPDAVGQSPNQFRITHRTESSSTAEDRDHGVGLTLEWAEDTASSIVTAAPNQAPTDVSLDDARVDENQAVGAAVGTLSTTDPDAADMHVYRLVAGAGDRDNASFQIAGPVLRTKAVFDYETKNSYGIRVQTDDGDGGTYEEALTITITDVNEAPTDVALSASTVAENTDTGTIPE